MVVVSCSLQLDYTVNVAGGWEKYKSLEKKQKKNLK